MEKILVEQPYKVLVRMDDAGRVVAINSSAFLQDAVGWTEIDSGYGDRYHHAQGNYLPGPLVDMRGIYRYKAYQFADAPAGKIIARFFKDDVEYLIFERTEEEMDSDYATRPAPPPTTEQRVGILEATTDDIVLMMADLIGGN